MDNLIDYENIGADHERAQKLYNEVHKFIVDTVDKKPKPQSVLELAETYYTRIRLECCTLNAYMLERKRLKDTANWEFQGKWSKLDVPQAFIQKLYKIELLMQNLASLRKIIGRMYLKDASQLSE